MTSPMPFLGPVGAVRVAIIDGELVVNPTLPEVEEHEELDLIVVGTPDALTMVEAGANQVAGARVALTQSIGGHGSIAVTHVLEA